MKFFAPKRETLDQIINRLVKENRMDQIEPLLEEFDPSRLEGREKEAWHLHRGVAAWRKGDRQEAFQRFLKGHGECPDSDLIRFSLAQEYEFLSEPEKMLELFKACRFPQVSCRHLLAAARCCYLWDFMEEGWNMLMPIVNACFQLGVADDHFLHARGLPFFGETWAYLLCFCVSDRQYDRIRNLTRECSERLSDFDFDRLWLMLKCYEDGDFGGKIRELEGYLQNAEPEFPLGYQRTQLAAFRSLGTPDCAAAGTLLDTVSFQEGDFPWLGDVILAHKARLARLRGDQDGEKQLQDQFFKKQPLLFEPDHAVDFGLLDYQELLKQEYRKKRGPDPLSFSTVQS